MSKQQPGRHPIAVSASFIASIQEQTEVDKVRQALLPLKGTDQLAAIQFLGKIYQARTHAEAFQPEGESKESLDYYRGKVDGAVEFLAAILEFIGDAEEKIETQAAEKYRVPMPARRSDLA